MILVQGCSFTYGQELPNPSHHRYSTLLKNKLGDDTQVVNIAGVGKDNFVAYQEIHTYLLNARLRSNVQMPETIIWQLTDTFRRGIPAHAATNSWQPNDLTSQLSSGWKYTRRYAKMVSWRLFLKTGQHIAHIKKFKDARDVKKEIKLLGHGTKLVYTDPEDPTGNPARGEAVGDGSFILNELTTGLHIHTIQEMCKKMKIRLIILNYYGTPSKILEDPIYQSIDRDNYLISNSEAYGMYNHLMWKGFDRPDAFHFNIDAHDYQADVLYDFIVNNKRVKIDEEQHPDIQKYPVFDYV